MHHRRRHIIVPTALIILLLMAIVLLWQFNQPQPNASLNIDEVFVGEGKVVHNNGGDTELDAPAALLMELDDGTVVRVEYHRGIAECENRVDGISLSQGERIEVRGAVTSTDTVSTCDSKGFYARQVDK